MIACIQLGDMYAGNPEMSDLRYLAIEYYELAKTLYEFNDNKNDPEQLLNYCVLLAKINRNDPSIITFYDKILECNDNAILSQAYHNLGYKYQNGYGCTIDLPTSLMYYSKAGLLGNDDSIGNMRICIEYIRDTEKEINYPTFSKAMKMVGNEITILLDCILISVGYNTMGIILQCNKTILKHHEDEILSHDYLIFKYHSVGLLAHDYRKYILNENIKDVNNEMLN